MESQETTSPLYLRASRTPRRVFPQAAEFRFYEELNDFLRPEQRYQTVPYRFDGQPGIKDPIEALGVPHVEVDLIVVNGASVGFDYRLQDGDRVAVYPKFESLDVSPIVKLRERPLQCRRPERVRVRFSRRGCRCTSGR